MLVCPGCHKAIHFGGSIKATPGTLAANGDRGKRNTRQWREYLNMTQ